MTYKKIIQMIEEYLEEPHSIDKEWVEALLICKKALLDNDIQKAEIEKLNVELVGMRGACNSYKMHYDNAKAEIERLKKLVERQEEINQELYEEMVGRQKEEVHIAKKYAIKEFAERLKKFMHTKFKYLDAYEFEYVTENDIDNLVKEMVGEGK